MPAMVIFQHGRLLTFAVIDRRLHKRDESKDVLEKVTLIKDINLGDPHRAHIDIPIRPIASAASILEFQRAP